MVGVYEELQCTWRMGSYSIAVARGVYRPGDPKSGSLDFGKSFQTLHSCRVSRLSRIGAAILSTPLSADSGRASGGGDRRISERRVDILRASSRPPQRGDLQHQD